MWSAKSEHVQELEQLCDRFATGLPDLTSFILPGGSELASRIHLARTVCRRAERATVVLDNEVADLNPEIVKYLNRLSDLFFVLARWALKQENKKEVLWQKGLS